MSLRVLKWVCIALLGAVTTVASLFIPVEVPSQEAMANVRLGLPLRFARQDQAFLTPPTFPRPMALTSIHESPPAVDMVMFLLSWLFWVGVWWAAARAVQRAFRAVRSESHINAA
jgi:hypothetical protein